MPYAYLMRLITKSKILAYLTYPTRSGGSAHGRVHALVSIGLVLASSAAAIAFGTASSTEPLRVSRVDTIQALPISTDIATLSADEDVFVHESAVRTSDTVGNLLQRLGVTDDQALSSLRANPDSAPLFSQLSPGKIVNATVTASGALRSLTFPLNGGQDSVLHINHQANGFQAQEVKVSPTTQTVVKSAEIRYSLFGATDAAGIPDSIASQLADIFGGDIDFHRDLRKGDRFSVVYEVANRPGLSARNGRILAAEFTNNGKQYQAFWFDNEDGKGAYYSADGKSLHKAFLRSPLEFSRVTSGFTSARFHPVLQTWRAHKGVDYGAPIGTKVRATSDGIVEFSGQQGGYGKVVILRHQHRYSTLYGHLSTIPANIRPGQRVQQGDTIGYTGMSGLASGPHLHYEFRVDGTHQNPLTIALPGAPPLPRQSLGKFQAAIISPLDYLALVRSTNVAALD